MSVDLSFRTYPSGLYFDCASYLAELIDKLLSACGGEVTISKQVIKEKLQLSEKDIT